LPLDRDSLRMPQRDSIHNLVKQALIKEGWQITDDPYIISYGERFLFIDLGVTELTSLNSCGKTAVIGASLGDCRLAIEIKEFRGRSKIADLEQAIGQYVLYQILLRKVDPQRDIYLAITTNTHEEIFREPIGETVVSDLPLNLIVINPNKIEVQEWIPPPTIATL